MSPVRYNPDIEVIGEDEAKLTAAIVEQIGATSADSFERHRHAIRAAHAKSHAILKGELIVADGLPEDLRQGVFARPGRYGVIARLSSASSDIHADRVPAPRGLAIKILGVEGRRLSPEIPGSNQDFLMVNFPALPFGTIARYQSMLGFLQANEHAPDSFQRLVAALAGGAKGLMETLGVEPGATLDALACGNNHPLGETYHTQAALRFGDYIAKLSVAPKSANVRALAGEPLDESQASCHRDAVARLFEGEAAEFELSAQLCVDIASMPVEDVSVIWDEALSPHRPLATLSFPRQSTYSPERRVYGDEVLAFTPWNGVEAHKPLGGIMRIRRAAYARSAQYRHDMNARPRVEPARVEDLPD